MKLIFTYILLSSLIYAKSYALIIGINKNGLKGAVNDAEAIRELMLFQGLNIRDIILLKNRKATKKNILKELREIADKLKRGDRFYLFFSGHGTSLLDPNFATVINSDKRLLALLENSGGLIPWDFDENRAYKTLIIAKRDLAPIFKKIDTKGVFGMVMIDACFSGMSFKDINPNSRKQLPIPIKLQFNSNSIYPYKNIVYLASTVVSDWALEDKSHRPYRGFFSRALEQCLYKYNSLRELESCINRVPMAQSIVVYPKYRDVSSLFINHKSKGSYKTITRVSKEKGFLDELLKLTNSSDDIRLFTVQKNGIERKVYTPNTLLKLKISTKRDGYLVFLNFRANGKVKLHYPKYQLRKIRANSVETLGEFRATAPFGEEYMMAFLVNRAVAKRFIEIYKKNMGNLDTPSSIKEVIELLQGIGAVV